MKVVIHQPEYLPWLGYFDKINNCDLFVVFDHVQYQRGFINRNKIKTPQNWQWLTVPIVHKFHRSPITEVKINNQLDWRKDNQQALVHNYGQAPYFKKYSDFFKDVYSRDWDSLAELDIYLLKNLMEMLGLKTPLERSSSLKAAGKSTELLIDICKKVGADTYLSGQGGRNYMDLDRFTEEGIKVEFQEFSHPTYPQQFPKAEFEPQMSIIDLLSNCGEESLKIINQNK